MSDEIVRLLHAVKTENAKLRAALKPFAIIGGPYKGEEGRDPEINIIDKDGTGEVYVGSHFGSRHEATLDADDFRAAYAAISQDERADG